MGIRIYSKEDFYPLHWKQWEALFDADRAEEVLAAAEKAYSVHTWGHETRDVEVRPASSGEAYSILAKQNCPVVYRDAFGKSYQE